MLSPASHCTECFCGRKLKLTEEDSLSPFIRLQEKKKEAQEMQRVLEDKEEVRKVEGLWSRLGWPTAFWRVAVSTDSQALSPLCFQAFRVRMEDITCRWKELRAKEAELKAHMKKSERTLKVQLPLLRPSDTTLRCTANSSPPLGRRTAEQTPHCMDLP